MSRIYSLLATLVVVLSFSAHADIQPNNPYPKVTLVTSLGNITVELDRTRAPLTVANFLRYVDKGVYAGTIFHRIVPGFVVQGGGYDKDFQLGAEFDPIPNESGNGLKNEYGTIAMARESAPHTATRQFYFNINDNPRLDPSDSRWGYAVFGHIIKGQDVLEKLAAVESMPFDEVTGWQDVPKNPPLLEQVIVEPAP
ncbi:peptidylprolyl isomerase [Idiomarina tyrosinivorans]|uniref:Peptidyl-prolyl cis-trans isomerase n=1 Tax=Idiomarina tyrosinivorans TaxID=1445662 RepID=A0A432ZM08_9GAMM|nr:peptidylprolyl isomerase [Idiomarina tyrosinivorans]RUO78782.1 peptidylprolyl isomerase [Idiomarina tyrosinivorans]